MSNEQAIVPVSEYAMAKMDQTEFNSILKFNAGEGGFDKFDLLRVTIPPGGATQWMIPGLTGDEATPQINGIIIAHRDGRVYYEKSMEDSEENSPPDCVSEDMVTGHGNPGGACAKCRLAEWGSDPKTGKAQACKTRKMLFIMRPDSKLPLLLSLPPTSIRNATNYFMRLTNSSLRMCDVITGITIETTKSGSFKYGIAKMQMIKQLTVDEKASVMKVTKMIMPHLQKISIDDQDKE